MIRPAGDRDLDAIRAIYNEGIADRIATLDADLKDEAEIREWFEQHDARYAVLVEEIDGDIAGWASLNRYSHRCAYAGVADISVYVRRDRRGTGVGTRLLHELERVAVLNRFHKLVLFALDSNRAGRALYDKCGFREVGVFKEQGRLNGKFVDVVAMERVLVPSVLFVCRHNTGRSQMAEAYLRSLADGRVRVASAGTIPASRPEPVVVAAMAEDGIDISGARPKLIDAQATAGTHLVITMGCDVTGVARIDDDWGLPDPKGQPPDRVREIRDLVKGKVRVLIERLGVE